MTTGNRDQAFLKEQAQALLQQNQLQAAKEIYARICEIDPNDAQAWHTLGMINAQLGNFADAAAAWRQAVTVKPDFAEGHCNLGNAMFSLGKYDEAVNHYRDALHIQPRYGEALSNMGTAFNQLNRLEEAAQCYEAALDVAANALIHYNLANVRTHQQLLDEAVTHYQRALVLEPKQPDFHNNLGNALHHLGRYADAEAAYREALRIDPHHATVYETHANLGTVLLQMNRYDEARASYGRALELKPDFPRAVAGIASVLEKQGEFEQAYAVLQPYLQGSKEDCNITLAFASLCHHLDRCDEAVIPLERLIAEEGPALDTYSAIMSHFALARLLDAAGDYDLAFDHYRQGNELSERRFDFREHLRRIEELMDVYTAPFMANAPRARHGSGRPVFIVGMPRSGTSLVEQILASHPAVFGAGELDEIYRIVVDLPEILDSPLPYPQCIQDMTQTDADRAAKRYLDHISSLAPPDAQRITNKMPANFQHLGLIALLFPEARIIHCVRDPLDTCLSCYFQQFSEGLFFTYDLGNLGAYYRQYLRLMEHWRKVLKVSMMEIRYEELVADQEGISRKIVEHCGLKWDERCLRFHETQRVVATASYDQVRQPLYSRSVGRWQHYERHLEPLRRALDQASAGETAA